MNFARIFFVSLFFVFVSVRVVLAATHPVGSSFITLTPYAVDQNGDYTYVLQGSVPVGDYNNNSDWWGFVSYDIRIIGDNGEILAEINDLNSYGYAHEFNGGTGPELNIYGIIPLNYTGENVNIQLIEDWPDVPYVTENDSVLFEIEQYNLNAARAEMDEANQIGAPAPPIPNMPDADTDSDSDGIPDVSDPTPGNGDADGDGTIDALDSTPNGDPVDSDGDGVPDAPAASPAPAGNVNLTVNVNCAQWGSAKNGEEIEACIADWGEQAVIFFIGVGIVGSLILLPFIGYLLASANPGNIEKGWELLNSWFWGIALLFLSGFIVSIIGRDLFGVS
jgi:hypothetical protein